MSNISRFLIVADKGDSESILRIGSDIKRALDKQSIVYFTDYFGGEGPCPGFVLRAKQVKPWILALDVEDASLDSAQVLELLLLLQHKTKSLKVVAHGKDLYGDIFSTDEVSEYVDLIELEF